LHQLNTLSHKQTKYCGKFEIYSIVYGYTSIEQALSVVKQTGKNYYTPAWTITHLHGLLHTCMEQIN